jgi:gamma-glutamylcyclotransferase (GGCT)/AIG2-like uncharacterized protein YtfP
MTIGKTYAGVSDRAPPAVGKEEPVATPRAGATDEGDGLYANVHHVFVFGTLKEGFPLHRQGLGDTLKGLDCRTIERFPMFIAGPWYAPMMMNEPRCGFQVRGELYEVDDARLHCLTRWNRSAEAWQFPRRHRGRGARWLGPLAGLRLR